jgi:hypothetical protein
MTTNELAPRPQVTEVSTHHNRQVEVSFPTVMTVMHRSKRKACAQLPSDG